MFFSHYKIGKFVCALSLNLLFWEIVIRLFISSPCTQRADAVFGYMNIPEASFLHSSEGYSRGRFNIFGFNDLEPVTEGHAKRIFVLGDSYTESLQVPVKKSYVQVLENLLNGDGSGHAPVDVIKLARDGLTPAHYPALMKKMTEVSPDLVVLQFWAHSGGDLYEDDIICKYTKNGTIEKISVHPKIEDKGKEKVRFLINHSALLYHSLRRLKPVIMKVMYSLSGLIAGPEPHGATVKDVRSLEDMSKRLSFILQEIQSSSKRIVAFYIPEPGIFFRKDVRHNSETLQALQRATRETGVLFVDLTKEFRQYYVEHDQPLNGFLNTIPGTGHLNLLGHRLVAETLYRPVKNNLFQ